MFSESEYLVNWQIVVRFEATFFTTPLYKFCSYKIWPEYSRLIASLASLAPLQPTRSLDSRGRVVVMYHMEHICTCSKRLEWMTVDVGHIPEREVDAQGWRPKARHWINRPRTSNIYSVDSEIGRVPRTRKTIQQYYHHKKRLDIIEHY
jgi:hypothetical protein